MQLREQGAGPGAGEASKNGSDRDREDDGEAETGDNELDIAKSEPGGEDDDGVDDWRCNEEGHREIGLAGAGLRWASGRLPQSHMGRASPAVAPAAMPTRGELEPKETTARWSQGPPTTARMTPARRKGVVSTMRARKIVTN